MLYCLTPFIRLEKFLSKNFLPRTSNGAHVFIFYSILIFIINQEMVFEFFLRNKTAMAEKKERKNATGRIGRLLGGFLSWGY